MELMQNELVKIIIVILIGSILFTFIYLVINGEASQLTYKSKLYALLIDSAFNSDNFARENLTLLNDLGLKDNFEVVLIKEDSLLEIRKEGILVGESYRIVKDLNKDFSTKDSGGSLTLYVEQKVE